MQVVGDDDAVKMAARRKGQAPCSGSATQTTTREPQQGRPVLPVDRPPRPSILARQPAGVPPPQAGRDLAAMTDPLREALHPGRGWVHRWSSHLSSVVLRKSSLGYDPARLSSSIKRKEHIHGTAPHFVTVAENGQGRYQQEVVAGRHRYLADEPASMGGKMPARRPSITCSVRSALHRDDAAHAEVKALPLRHVGVALSHEKRSKSTRPEDRPHHPRHRIDGT